MKKFLALVLALIMTMSLVTISAGAEDFTDAASMNYEEAVVVMSELDVVGGYADGSFNPQAGLTRGAAAKIICNMILGPTTADALNADAAPYSDVSVDNVFAGYIAYCAKEGIISGYADGTFRPAAPLTGYAFMKMLLGALGYDPAVEGYTGANWSINVAKQALALGLDAGLVGEFNGSKALTREEACLYALNTLEAQMVEYKNASTISVGDITIQNNSSASTVDNIATDYNSVTGVANDYKENFCEKYFKKLTKIDGTDDDFGRTASHAWKLDTEVIYNVVATPDVVINGKTKAADVATALAGYKVMLAGDTKATKINNTTEFTSEATTAIVDLLNIGSANVALDITGETIAKAVADETKNGMTLEFYADDDNVITEVVVIWYSVEKVNKVTVKDEYTTYNLSLSGNFTDYVDEDLDDSIVLNGEVAKGDMVTVAVDEAGVAHVYPTETVVGTQTARNLTKQTITIDGVVYTVGEGVVNAGAGAKVATSAFSNQEKAYNYFVDQFGYVVATSAINTASTDYAYIVDTFAKVTAGMGGFTPYIQVKAVLADGTVGTYDVALYKEDGKWYVDGFDYELTVAEGGAAVISYAASLEAGSYGYSLKDGVITLEALTMMSGSGDNAEDSVYKTGLTSVAYNTTSKTSGNKTVLFDNSTIVVVYNSTKDTAAVYAVKDLPKTASLAGSVVVKSGVDTKVNIAKAQVMFATAALTADSVEEYVYIDASEYTLTINKDGDNERVYVATYANGETIELTGPDGTSKEIVADGLYTFDKDNTVDKDNKITLTGEYIDSTGADMSVVGDMVKVGGNYYYMTENTEVVYIDTTLDEVDTNKGIVVLVKDGSTVTNDVAAIFVTAE